MPRQIANVHDAFFKQVLADPELAGQFLREQLPAEVADLLGPESPEALPAPSSTSDFESITRISCSGFISRPATRPSRTCSWSIGDLQMRAHVCNCCDTSYVF
jgi:Putative transposase, YhgA-like